MGYELGVLADAYPDCAFVGGEPADSGVALARELLGDRDRVSVERFDFRDDEWDLLERVFGGADGATDGDGRAGSDRRDGGDGRAGSDRRDGGDGTAGREVAGDGMDRDEVVQFTQGSLTAVPTARGVVDGPLSEYAGRVREGVHLEHVTGLHPEDTLLGQLRRSYVDQPGYNDDLLDSLRPSRGST